MRLGDDLLLLKGSIKSKGFALDVLPSEKIYLAARHYSPVDPFVGLLEAESHCPLETSKMEDAYRILISKRTSLNMTFNLENSKFFKDKGPVPFSGLRILKNFAEVDLWKRDPLDINLGPLYDMAVCNNRRQWSLYFKFHHLIIDGLSLYYFFEDFFKIYKNLCFNKSVDIPSDFKVYEEFMLQQLSEDKGEQYEKEKFWKNYLPDEFVMNSSLGTKNSFLPLRKTTNEAINETTNEAINETTNEIPREFESEATVFFLSRACVRKIYHLKKTHSLNLFAFLVTLYGEALQEVFDISTPWPLRLVSACRNRARGFAQKRLIASLSRGFPLIINKESKPLMEKVCDTKRVLNEIFKNMPIDPSPWDNQSLKAFSQNKREPLSFSLSYSTYREEKFLPLYLKGLTWQFAPMDLSLFIITSESQISFSWTYKKYKISGSDIKKIKRTLEHKIVTAYP